MSYNINSFNSSVNEDSYRKSTSTVATFQTLKTTNSRETELVPVTPPNLGASKEEVENLTPDELLNLYKKTETGKSVNNISSMPLQYDVARLLNKEAEGVQAKFIVQQALKQERVKIVRKRMKLASIIFFFFIVLGILGGFFLATIDDDERSSSPIIAQTESPTTPDPTASPSLAPTSLVEITLGRVESQDNATALCELIETDFRMCLSGFTSQFVCSGGNFISEDCFFSTCNCEGNILMTLASDVCGSFLTCNELETVIVESSIAEEVRNLMIFD